ncbi:MAG: hypothetical protein LBH57_07695, partial [Treponema sp.]|nr:hypothetical protein [Treponema sp.]
DLRRVLEGLSLGSPESAAGKLRPILSNEKIFALNLYSVETGKSGSLGSRVEGYFAELIGGKGAVRATLQKYLRLGRPKEV